MTLKALKDCITGITTKETTTEYCIDNETGDLKVVKQKVNEKTLPPNSDLMKLIFAQMEEEKTDYNQLTDAQLEDEKQRLLKLLKEENNASGKVKNKSKV